LALFKIFGRVLKLILCIFVRISLEWQLVKDFACTFIPLIPKMLVLTKVCDLWVILLIMGSVIPESQSVFVKGKQIFDGIIIVNERIQFSFVRKMVLELHVV
jgi:hypothetical protein